jgi:hypothetical protein
MFAGCACVPWSQRGFVNGLAAAIPPCAPAAAGSHGLLLPKLHLCARCHRCVRVCRPRICWLTYSHDFHTLRLNSSRCENVLVAVRVFDFVVLWLPWAAVVALWRHGGVLCAVLVDAVCDAVFGCHLAVFTSTGVRACARRAVPSVCGCVTGFVRAFPGGHSN